jgi:hypothetical protein
MCARLFFAGADWTPLISRSTYGHKQRCNFSHVTDHTTPRPSDGVTRAAIGVLRLSARVCSTRFKPGISRRTFFVEQATLSFLSHAPWAYAPYPSFQWGSRCRLRGLVKRFNEGGFGRTTGSRATLTNPHAMPSPNSTVDRLNVMYRVIQN